MSLHVVTVCECVLVLVHQTTRTLLGHPPMSNHMAANLAKWCKTKFFSGYKHFTVVPTDCSDGRPSDTEELLGRHHEYSAPSEKTASEGKTSTTGKRTPADGDRRQLNFEEFECDVSVEGGLDAGGQERQEFSFTLYDFDGHGKITKDDIAGLVTTIYDTLGSSIKVPHYGSKTIKVKLTVSPDQRKKESAQEVPMSETVNGDKCATSQSAVPPTSTTHRVKFKRDLNVTIRESRVPRRPHRRKHCSVPEDKFSCSSSCGLSENNEDGAADISEDDEEDEDNVLGSHHSTPKTTRDSKGRRYQQHASSRYRHQHSAYCAAETNTPLRQRSKKRSSSLQREELLQIIQANMEKNNLSFQTTRKQCGERLSEQRHSHHRPRHKLRDVHYLGECPDSRNNYYLDLAGQDCHYDKFLVCTSTKHCQQPCRGKAHNRSRSQDLTGGVRYHHLLDPHAYHAYHDQGRQHLRSKSHEAEYHRKFPPVVVGHSSSPHHLKHRNREQDQARAMAQVVRWLEQEFSASLNTSEKLKANIPTPKSTPSKAQPNPTQSPKKEDPPNSPTASSIGRHEHHHVHEHVHHHYHHYQETPVLV